MGNAIPVGPIVRISPNALSINTVSALREIYGLRKPKVRKSDWYCSIASSEGHSTFNEVNQGKHNFRRRVLEQALSSSALKSAERYIINNVRLWVELLGSSSKSADGWTLAKNMKEWSSYLSYDIMGETAFGKQFSCMESEEHRYVPDIILSSAKVAYIVSSIHIYVYMFPKPIPLPLNLADRRLTDWALTLQKVPTAFT